MVDLDSVIKEDNEAPKGEETPLEIFAKYRANLEENYANVVVIVNNPCLEFWFLLHFKKTSKYYDTCAEAKTELKKYLKNYEKTRKFFTKQGDDIYLKLKPRLKIAVENSIALGNYDKKNPKKAMCEMELFFQSSELKKHFE
ncbi:MAG: RloB domain-containing protein [Bacteroidales bacterium]